MLALEIDLEEADAFALDDIEFLVEEGICEDEESAKEALMEMRDADRESKSKDPVLALCVTAIKG